MAPYSPPTKRSWRSIETDFLKTLAKKAKKYGKLCSSLDLLAYVNLVDSMLQRGTIEAPIGLIMKHGWRSVSIVTDTYSAVLAAKPNAPAFIQNALRRTFGEKPLFE
jgi:hypothetical protein